MSDPRLGRVTVTVRGKDILFERAYTTWSEDNCLLVTDGYGEYLTAFSATAWQACHTSYASALEPVD